MKELIERLREAGRPFTDDLYSEAAAALERLAAERNELQAALDGAKLFEQSHKHALTVIERANSQTEEFERKWYLVCDERDALAQNAERVRVYKQRYFGAIAERDALRADAKWVRRILCALYSKHPYMDDGEAQDSEEHPFIDFLRDPASVLQVKMQERGLKKLAAIAGEKA